MTCEELSKILASGSLIRSCDLLPTGNQPLGPIRIQTLFRYPGGEYVDLFWRARFPDGSGIELTDFGQTMSQLLSMGIDADATSRRKEFISDVCAELGVQRRGGELVIDLAEPLGTLDAFMKVGQACVRVADLFVTQRTRIVGAFGEDFEEGLTTIGRPFEASVSLTGIAGRRITLDYVVGGENRKNGILTMSAKNAARAHDLATDTFTKWYDLAGHQTDYQFITVVDSAKIEFFKESDIDRLEAFSSVVPYPDEADTFIELLSA